MLRYSSKLVGLGTVASHWAIWPSAAFTGWAGCFRRRFGSIFPESVMLPAKLIGSLGSRIHFATLRNWRYRPAVAGVGSPVTGSNTTPSERRRTCRRGENVAPLGE